MRQESSAPGIVGRDREVARLRAALRDAVAGRGRLVLISGEPGIGKSTLAAAIASEAASAGALVSSARAPDAAGAPPYWLWAETLRRQSLRPVARPDIGLVSRILPELAPAGQPPHAVDVEATAAERFRLAEAIRATLLSTRGHTARVVVLDDVHAADPSSLEVLAHVASGVSEGRALIVATHRDAPDDVTSAFQTTLAHVSRYDSTERIVLAGLEAGAVQLQLAALVGRDVEAHVAAQVRARTGGNPFFIAEIGRMIRDDAGLGTARALVTVTPRVRDVIAMRLNRLPSETRDVLETAALIAPDIAIDLLAAACERPPSAVLAAIDPAVQAGVMRHGDLSSSVSFVHALVAETLAASLSLARTAALHERVALAIESTRAVTLDDWLPALARHWASAVPSEHASRRTVAVARLAAQQAEERLAFADAVPLWQLALDVAERSGSPLEVRTELQLGAARALFRSGAVEAALDMCVHAARTAAAARRPDLIASAALIVESVSEPEWAARLIELAESALGSAGDDDVALQARLHAQVGSLVHLIAPADVLREQTESRLALALAEQSGDPHALQAAVRAHQLVISGFDGADERLRNAARMIQLSQDSGDAWPELWGRLWTVDAMVQLGRLQEAAAQLDQLEPVVARIRWPVARWHLLRSRAAILQASGRLGEALRAAETGVQLLSGSGLEHAMRTQATFVEVHVDIAGDVPGGDERLERLRRFGAQVPGSLARLVLSLARDGNVEEARAVYARMPPVDRWNLPRYVLPLQLALRLRAAIAVTARDDVARLVKRIEPMARVHMAPGSGCFVTLGSARLYTGLGAGFLGDLDRAAGEITKAVDENTRCGATALAVVAREELAEVMLERGRGTDLDHARRLASGVHDEAQRLGMPPVAARASKLLRGLPRRRLKSNDLTARELQVARCVADGSTNRQIAVQLGLSERTVENHLDHIFRKLGIAGRAQLASWVTAEAAAKR